MSEWIAWIWDWAKRLFGRSKTIFTNIMGLLASSWVELYDPISMFNWDDVVDKHEMAIGIGIGVMVLNMIFKAFADNGEAKFKAEPEPVIKIDEESLERSPKAE